MVRARTPRVVLIALVFGLALTAFAAGAHPTVAAAASTHHAAVVVDTGSDVHKVLITFSEDSISGIDALQRAGANPVIYTFGGQGGAVCRLYGVGRDAGPGCLGGQDGDNRYWAYFRAPAGTSAFKYSSVGAGSSRVHDGDVEGWRFATGAAPQYVSVASLLPPPPPPPTTTPTTKTTSTGSTVSGASTPGGSSSAVSPAGESASAATMPTLPRTGGTTATGAPAAGGSKGNGAPTSSTKRSKASDDGTGTKSRDVRTALASSDQGGGGSSAWSLIGFAALIVAIAAAILVVRRARRKQA